MKPTLALLIVLLFTVIVPGSITAKDQFKIKTSVPTLVVTAGVGMPIGKYHNSEIIDPKSGFAKNGIRTSIDLTVPIAKKHFGIAVNLVYNNNSVDNSKISSSYTTSQMDGNTYVFTSGSNQISTLVTGAYVSMPIGKLAIDFTGLAGISLVTHPTQEFDVYKTNNSHFIFTAANNAGKTISFAYGGNVTMRFTVVKHLVVIGQCGLLKANAKYSSLFYNSSGTGSLTYDGNHPVLILHFAGGIGYQF